MNRGVILASQAVGVASSGGLVAALRGTLHTCGDQRQGTISVCVFLMLGITFQQPEETLNTCLRKAHQTVLRNSITHNHKGGGATSEAYFSSSQHRFFGH
jgi:hypothetical protein